MTTPGDTRLNRFEDDTTSMRLVPRKQQVNVYERVIALKDALETLHGRDADAAKQLYKIVSDYAKYTQFENDETSQELINAMSSATTLIPTIAEFLESDDSETKLSALDGLSFIVHVSHIELVVIKLAECGIVRRLCQLALAKTDETPLTNRIKELASHFIIELYNRNIGTEELIEEHLHPADLVRELYINALYADEPNLIKQLTPREQLLTMLSMPVENFMVNVIVKTENASIQRAMIEILLEWSRSPNKLFTNSFIETIRVINNKVVKYNYQMTWEQFESKVLEITGYTLSFHLDAMAERMPEMLGNVNFIKYLISNPAFVRNKPSLKHEDVY